MKVVVLSILVALTVGSEGVYQYDGYRVKVGFTKDQVDVDYLYDIPRTVRGVEEKGWRLMTRPEGSITNLKMYCSPGRMVCSLYNDAGFVSGLQIAIPVTSIDPALRPERQFVKWDAPAIDDEPAQVFWTASQYLFCPDSLEAGGGPILENNVTLQDDAIWVTGVDHNLMRIPLEERELEKTVLRRQNCLPGMGTHYYYKAERNDQCEELFSWFPLVKEGKLIGCGFQTFGQTPEVQNPEKQIQYFEDVPRSKSFVKLTIPDSPDCSLDLHEKYGLISLHIYHIDESWRVTCESSDSSNPKTAPSLAELIAALGASPSGRR